MDAKCAGQPLLATGFGVPTLNAPRPPASYGQFRKAFGVRMVPEVEAAQWWLLLLDVLRECGLEIVCVLARDVTPTRVSHHFCGLQRADGAEKAFTQTVIDGLHSDPSTRWRDDWWLRAHYVDRALSTRACGHLAGCSKTTIANWLRRHGIERCE